MKEGRLEDSIITNIKICLDQLAAIHRNVMGNAIGQTALNAHIFAALDAMKTVEQKPKMQVVENKPDPATEKADAKK